MLSKSALKRISLTIAVSILLSIFLSFFASPSISPLYGVYEGSNFTYDPALFKYEALAILNGQKPYIDFYDHKGIWHLGIYVLATLISKDYGLLVLEIISGTIAIYFYLETVKVLTTSLKQRHIAIFIYIIIRFLVGTGATIGIWLLPFVAGYLYFYTKAIKESKDDLFIYGSIFLGLTVSFALNSRPVDMVYVWGGVFFLVFYSIKEKKRYLLIKNALAAFVSFIIPTAIISLIAISNGFYGEMLNAMFLDNFKYIAREKGDLMIEQIVFRIVSSLILAIYVLVYFLYKKKEEGNKLNLFMLIMGVSSFLPLSFTIKFFSHYLASIPFVGVSIIYYIESSSKSRKYKEIGFMVLTSIASFVLSLTPLVYYTFGLGDFQYSKNEKDITALLNSIKEEDRVNGNIYAVDCSCQVYHLLGVIGDAKYYCNQTWWSFDNPSIMENTLTYVKENRPKYVVLWKETLDEKWEDALSGYTLVDDSAERFFIYKINI